MPHTIPESAITVASHRLDLAQAELGAAIAELTTTERADKRMVTQRLRLAFDEIVAAKLDLSTCLHESDDETPRQSPGGVAR